MRRIGISPETDTGRRLCRFGKCQKCQKRVEPIGSVGGTEKKTKKSGGEYFIDEGQGGKDLIMLKI